MSPNPEKLNVDITQCEDLPETLDALLECPQLQQFIDEYNARMRKEDPSWEDLSKEDLGDNRAMAEALEDMWNNEAIIKGRHTDIQAINHLIHYVVERAVTVDIKKQFGHSSPEGYVLNRLLSEDEVIERFDAIGVNIGAIRDACEVFYEGNGFAARLREAKLLHKTENYGLPLPLLTEGDMQKIGEAYSKGEIDTFFFHDETLGKMKTLEALDIKMEEESKNHLRTSQSSSKDAIQFLATKVRRDPRTEAPVSSFNDGIKGDMKPLTAAQAITLFTFLDQEMPNLRSQMFFQERFEGATSVAEFPLEVAVDEVLPTGEVLAITMVHYGNLQTRTIKPDAKEKYCAPRSAYIFPVRPE